MSESLAKLLRQSPFADLQESRNFLHWYKRQETLTAWDEEKRELAEELLSEWDKTPRKEE